MLIRAMAYLYVVYILNVHRAVVNLVSERLQAHPAVAMIRART